MKYWRLNANTCIAAAILFSGHPYIGRHYRATLILYSWERHCVWVYVSKCTHVVCVCMCVCVCVCVWACVCRNVCECVWLCKYCCTILQLYVWMAGSTNILSHWMVSATENAMTCSWTLEKTKYNNDWRDKFFWVYSIFTDDNKFICIHVVYCKFFCSFKIKYWQLLLKSDFLHENECYTTTILRWLLYSCNWSSLEP